MLFALPLSPLLARLFGPGPARPPVTRWFSARVRHGATRELPRLVGRTTVHCRAGQAWITHDGDPRDVVLQANESYVVDRGSRLTLHAMQGDCVLEIQVE